MTRMHGADPSQQGFLRVLFTRLVYAMTRRKVGRVVMPVQVAAHHSKLLWGTTVRWSNLLVRATWWTLL